jgi:hypothetical protein
MVLRFILASFIMSSGLTLAIWSQKLSELVKYGYVRVKSRNITIPNANMSDLFEKIPFFSKPEGRRACAISGAM